MPGPSITGSVADLFATLGLDVGPLSASLAESKALIREAGADMSLSLASLEARMSQVIASLSSGFEATTAYQAAMQSLGVVTGNTTKLTQAQVLALQAEKDALTVLIGKTSEAVEAETARVEAIAAYDAWEERVRKERIVRMNQEVQGSIQAAAVEQSIADERIAFLNKIAIAEERAATINKAAAQQRIAMANQVAEGEARAAAITQAAADVKIATANQIALAEVRAAAINQTAADARVAAANQVALGEARAESIRLEALAAEQVLADERIALANQIAIGTARAEAMQTEATAAAVKERILLANQYAEAEVRAAAIVKEAQAADAIPLRLGANLSAGGIRPTVGSGAGGMIAGAAAAFVGYESIKAFAEFDDALNKSFSIMKDVTDFQKYEMKRTAQDLSTQYGMSAAEIAKGFYFLESAGRTTEQALKELPAVVQYAFVSSADGVAKISTAAETLTSVFNAMKGSGQSIEHISDLLVKADSIAQGTAEQFGKAFAGKGAGAFQILGKSAEEALALLSVMAQVGIPAAQQQTALIQILRDLPKEAEKYQNVIITLNGHQMTFKELLYDSTGQMKNMSDILAELQTLFNGASTEVIQHDLALLHLNSRTNQTLQSILGMSGPMKDYQKQYENVAGATQKVASIRLESAATQFKQLGAAAKLAAIDMGEALAPTAGFVAGKLKETMVTVHDLTQGFIGLAKAAYEYYIQGKSPSAPKPAPGPAANIPGVSGSGSVEDPEADAKRKAAAERAANMRNQIATTVLDMQKRQEEASVDIEISRIKRLEQLHEVSAADSLEQLRALEESKIEIEARYAQKRLALEETKKTPLFTAKTNAILADAQIARQKADEQFELDVLAEKIKQKATLKKMDDDIAAGTDKLQTKFDLAWGKYHEGIVKAQDKTTEITVSIHDRLPAAFVPTYDAAIKLEEAFKKLGLSGVDAAGNAQAAWVPFFEEVMLHGRNLIEVEAGWGAVGKQIDRLGKTNIPLVIKLQNEYVEGLKRTRAPLVQILEAQEANLKNTIELKSRSGQFNDAEMIALTNLRIRTEALRDSTHELGLMYIETTKNVGHLWTSFGSGVADAILAGGKFWSFWKTIIKEFEKEMLNTVVNGVLKSVKDAILGLPGVSGALSSGVGKVLGLGGAAAGAGQQAASLTQASTAVGTAATAASGAAQAAQTATKAAGMGIEGITNMVTGAISAISGVIGNFQMAGINKTLDLIENYTRYLKIGLVEQGDSLLNDSHTIRNTLTDLMAFHWNVQATYLQQICEKLDALIGGGGISGVTMQPQLAMAGGGSGDILMDAGAGLSNDNSVTIDLSGSTFNGEATPQQVDAIFNKGIDRAKRSGAFRPGTWPR